MAGLESIIFFFTASFRQALNLLKYDDTVDDDKGCPLDFFAVFFMAAYIKSQNRVTTEI